MSFITKWDSSHNSAVTEAPLFSSKSFCAETNTLILNETIDYILSLKDSKYLFFKDVFHVKLFNLFRISLVLLHLFLYFSYYYFILFYYF